MLNYTILICICIAAIANISEQTSNLAIRRTCERRADEKFFSSEKCEAFKRCCRESCSKDRRSAVTNNCDERFYDMEEKDCVCGPPGSASGSGSTGSRGTGRHGNRGGSPTQTCDEAGNEIIGSGSRRCARFKECCSDTCRDMGGARENVCDGSMYSIAEKRCECRRDAGAHGGSAGRRGGGTSGSSSMGGGGNDMTETCTTEGEEAYGSGSKKCEKFNRCCRRECVYKGGVSDSSKCEGMIYGVARKHCSCKRTEEDRGSGRGGIGGGGRGRGSGEEGRGRGSTTANSRLTELCDAAGDRIDGSVSTKCRAFNSCCRRECEEHGGASDSQCEGRMYLLAKKQCTCRRGGNERGSGGSGRGIGGGSSSSGGLTELCDAAGDRIDGSGSRKCQAFNSCCRRECDDHGGVSDTSQCEGMMYLLAKKHCSCRRSGHGGGGNAGRRTGGGSSSSRTGSNSEIQEICTDEGDDVDGNLRDKCRAFKTCCERKCRATGKEAEENTCADYGTMYLLANKRCICGTRRSGTGSRGGEYERRRVGGGETDSNRRIGGSVRNSPSRECRSHVQRGMYSSYEKCTQFRRCCDRECDRDGHSTCDRLDFLDSTCHCD